MPVHPRRSLGCGRGEDEPAHQRRPGERHFLGDEAADRKAEQVDLVEAQRGHEVDRVTAHLGEGARCRTRRAPDADVVEGDDPVASGERVDQGRVPVVEVPAEVLQQHERNGALADVTVGVLNAVGGEDPPVGRVHIAVHGPLLGTRTSDLP
jgi:hypothetical protein